MKCSTRSIHLRSVALVAALLAFSTSLGGQSNAERVLSGGHTPSHDYDLIHQRVEVGNFDWDSTAFDGRVTTTVVSLRPGLDSVILDMGRQLEVRSIISAKGQRLQYS
ncbi:MAG: hypothetical protein M3Q75_08250, partial [Gemmatimonadota bacterium]|nr:hypothetical protein [Gemmatimonadota bacterium]